jgi:hypothetical protein
MKVRALKDGYIYDRRQKEGSEFVLKERVIRKRLADGKYSDEEIVLKPEDQLSEKWMQPVEAVESVEEFEEKPVKKKRKSKKKDEEVEVEEPIFSSDDDEVI